MNALVPVSAAPPMTISDVERVALAIAKGGLFGSRDPNAVLTLCLLAQAEGQHPAVVFRDYHIIQGRPAKKADAMLRDFITAGGKVQWHKLNDDCADATFTHPSGEARIEWTLARAKKAGIANPMWAKYPRQMLRSRVISEGVRTVFPGATSGLYEENEVRDITAESNPAVQEGGFIEGTVRDNAGDSKVGPDGPDYAADEPAKQAAHEDLREQLEQSVEQGKPHDPTKGWREPDSPYSTPTKLHAAMARLDHDLNGCSDSDMVYAVTTTSEWREFVRVAEKHMPHYLHGGEPAPEEFEGMIEKAARLVREFDSAEANNIADLARA